jgi:hypothetical protein
MIDDCSEGRARHPSPIPSTSKEEIEVDQHMSAVVSKESPELRIACFVMGLKVVKVVPSS